MCVYSPFRDNLNLPVTLSGADMVDMVTDMVTDTWAHNIRSDLCIKQEKIVLICVDISNNRNYNRKNGKGTIIYEKVYVSGTDILEKQSIS